MRRFLSGGPRTHDPRPCAALPDGQAAGLQESAFRAKRASPAANRKGRSLRGRTSGGETGCPPGLRSTARSLLQRWLDGTSRLWCWLLRHTRSRRDFCAFREEAHELTSHDDLSLFVQMGAVMGETTV